MTRLYLRLPFLVVASLSLWLAQGDVLRARTKVDVITLRNGDQITGEILKLERGLLQVKTDYLGTINIEWIGVARVTSPQTFDLETTNGSRFQGTLPAPEEDGTLMVSRSERLTAAVRRGDVVRMRTLDAGFWDRLEARVSFGLNVASANENRTYNLDTSSTYKAESFQSEVSYSSFLTSQTELPRQTRNQLSFLHQQYFGDRWFAVGLGRFQQNDELDLALRSTAGGGVGRFLIQRGSMIVKVAGGLGGTNERYKEEEAHADLESFGAVTFDYFQFEAHEGDVSTTLSVWPYLTDWGRVRMELNSSVRFKVFGDLTSGLSFWNSYDSRPPSLSGSKSDYGLSANLGYVF